MQHLGQTKQLFALALHQLADGNARPARYDAGDFLFRHLVAQQRAGFRLLGFQLLEFLLQLGQLAVFQLCRTVQIIAALGMLDLAVHVLNLLAELLHAADGFLFVRPLGLHLIVAGAHIGQFFLNLRQARLAQLVGFLLQGSLLDFMLHDLAADFIHFLRHGVHFGADHGAGLVHQVDGLVGR